ncbi:MAG: DNA-directed RNA polymerase subunit delta [Caldibacillus thermoamylovorans]|uniref:DNA-directed RNA polymerase subunit delta n=1 Tax=Caldibacillus thermoamylovorans TaxID=35841 RepID=UPI001D079947|nr:DNA-directed RNA polymerase subunit delta [Caldibacillus thermoamylovorans]MCB5935150.1 DNA-directed RNA polymerase subunit delta [Bacillus sp. DFI.2.34]MCB7076202.1 DNA-directed RNA polymerase subunit delta [Caldibacillus thermoamylovorans]
MSLENLTQEQLQEMSLIEIAYELLYDRKQPMHLNDLVDEVAKLLGATKEEVQENIAQFYTDLNIDGRFLNVGGNIWGYKGWYPVEQYEDDFVPTVRSKKKKAKVDEVEDDFEELEEDLVEYEEDLDEFIDEDEFIEEDDLEDVDDVFEDDEDIVDEEDEELIIDEEFEEELDDEEDIDEDLYIEEDEES